MGAVAITLLALGGLKVTNYLYLTNPALVAITLLALGGLKVSNSRPDLRGQSGCNNSPGFGRVESTYQQIL